MPTSTPKRPLLSAKKPSSVQAKALSKPKTARKSTRSKPPSGTDYLKKILTAKVYDVAHESALDVARNLGRRLHNQVLLKREDQQPVFSFKLRGAYNKMAQLSR